MRCLSTYRVAALVFLALLATLAGANGKFYRLDDLSVDMPYQRALVIHRDGVQTLVVESTFQAPVGEVAWVLPLPSKPTFVRTAPQSLLTPLTDSTTPRVMRGEGRDTTPAWLAATATALFCLLVLPRLLPRPGHAWLAYLGVAIPLTWVTFVVVERDVRSGAPKGSEVAPLAGAPASTGWRNVGPYKQTVLSGKAEPVLRWFDENRFQVAEADRAVIRGYADLGWVFHLSRIRVAEAGLAAPPPLLVVFPTERPVYPMRLTGVGLRRLTLDLCTITDSVMEAPGMDIWSVDQFKPPSWRADHDPESHVYARRLRGGDPHLLGSMAWNGATFTRLRGELDEEAMRRDIWPTAAKADTKPVVYLDEPLRRARWLIPLLMGLCVVSLFAGAAIVAGAALRWVVVGGLAIALVSGGVSATRAIALRVPPPGNLANLAESPGDVHKYRRFAAFVEADQTWSPETVDEDLARLVQKAGLAPNVATWTVVRTPNGANVRISWRGGRPIVYGFDEKGARLREKIYGTDPLHPFNSPESVHPREPTAGPGR